MFATAAVVSTVKNKKKRKRPAAKDWPPTSAQKKTLIPYGSRSWKFPRLDESPFKAVWMKILSLALEDCKNECKTRCRKMKYFGDVHSQLRRVVPTIQDLSSRSPLRIINSEDVCYTMYSHLNEYSPNQRVDLTWLSWTAGMEKLVWINTNKESSWTRIVTRFGQPEGSDIYPIYRYKDMKTWKRCLENYVSSGPVWVSGKIRQRVFERAIILAPKGVSLSAIMAIILETYQTDAEQRQKYTEKNNGKICKNK